MLVFLLPFVHFTLSTIRKGIFVIKFFLGFRIDITFVPWAENFDLENAKRRKRMIGVREIWKLSNRLDSHLKNYEIDCPETWKRVMAMVKLSKYE